MIDRRDFLGYSVAAAAGISDSTIANSATVVPVSIARTQVLEIGYHEYGNRKGGPVILLHGFPDDAHAYDDVAPALAKAGLRVLVPYLRGYGPTTFLDAKAPRMAQQAALGQDVIDFADALGLQRFIVCGYDWGGRAACIVAALHPDRVRAAVIGSGYSIQNTITEGPPGNPAILKAGWYMWYFNTEAGRRGLEQNRREICKFLWHDWSPAWNFSDEAYNLTAPSFDNPAFVDCVVHSYRHRAFNAPGEPRFEAMERRLAERPPIEVPTVLCTGTGTITAPPREITPAEKRDFPKLVARRLVEGAGHCVPRERPEEIIQAVQEAYKASA